MYTEDTMDGGAPSGLAPREVLAALLRFWWLIIALTVAGLFGGVQYAARQAPVYEATSRIVIESSAPSILSDVTPVVDTGGGAYWANREYLETQYRILRSTAIAQEVAIRLGLHEDPVFLGLDGVDDAAELERMMSAVDAVDVVRNSLTALPVDDSRLVAISARAYSADLAAALSTTAAEVYIERNLQRLMESTDSAARWLNEQHETLSASLRASEAALVEFRRRHNLIAVNFAENLSLSSRMESTSEQLAVARLEADQARALSAQVQRALRESDSLLDVGAGPLVENTLIQSLKAELYGIESERIALSARYMDNHPLMQALEERRELAQQRVDREIRHVTDSLQQRAARAEEIVRLLEGRLIGTEQEVQQLGTHEVEYSALQRDAEANRALFEMIERRRKEVELTRNSQRNNVELLEAARVPARPISPNTRVITAVAGAGAFALSLLLVFLIGTMDSTVRSQEMLERQFGLSFLGLVPRIKPKLAVRASARGPARGQKWDPDTYVADFPKSAAAEACRSIRTNLNFLASEEPLDFLLVTSPGPREGKTMSAVSMATVMAQSGTRVLLVDADLRRPRVHKVFKMSNDHGLSDVLMRGASPLEHITQSKIPNLDVLASGPVPPNPAELLGSDRFRAVLKELKTAYDRVIIDSPPVAPVTDAAVLSSSVDGVVLVVRALKTRTEMLGRAVESLAAVDANVVGVVLNDVDVTARRAGYYYYYYRQYGEYYGQQDESDAAA